MDKFNELNRKVGLCFQKTNYANYFYSSQEDKDSTCRKERDEFIEYINSDSMDFKNILNEKLKKVKGNNLYI